MPDWNIASNILATLPGDRRGLVALTQDGSRHEWTFGEIAHVSSRFAAGLSALGVGKGDVVLTFMGNTPEWAFTLTACWRPAGGVLPGSRRWARGGARDPAPRPRAGARGGSGRVWRRAPARRGPRPA